MPDPRDIDPAQDQKEERAPRIVTGRPGRAFSCGDEGVAADWLQREVEAMNDERRTDLECHLSERDALRLDLATARQERDESRAARRADAATPPTPTGYALVMLRAKLVPMLHATAPDYLDFEKRNLAREFAEDLLRFVTVKPAGGGDLRVELDLTIVVPTNSHGLSPVVLKVVR